MVESEWSIIIFSKYSKIQFAWPAFQKRSWTVMTIMSTNRKDKKYLEISSMETYLTSHNDQEKKTLVKRICFTCWNLFNSNFSVLISSCNFDVEKNSSVFMYAMNIQNDVIGLVLRENYESKTGDRLYCMTERMSLRDMSIFNYKL